MKIKIMILVLVLLSMLAGCAADPELPDAQEAPDPNTNNSAVHPEAAPEPVLSSNEISQISRSFLNALNETGFDLKMDQQNYEDMAKTILLPGGESLFETGYFYKFENLKGEEYAYGQSGAVISLNTSVTDDGEIFDTYELYINNFTGISDIPLPGSLSFGATFEESLKDLGIYHTYQAQMKSDDKAVELFNENGERLNIYFAGLHGETVDNSLENVRANLVFRKDENENTMICSLYYSEGTLFACEYTSIIRNLVLTEAVTHDKITAYFYQRPSINSNMNLMPVSDTISGTIDAIVFTADSIELTVTIKSTAEEKEVFDYYISGWLSADVVAKLGPFSFEAEKDEKTQTSTYKDPYPSWQNDYFNMYVYLSGLGPFTLSNGRMYYDTSMSR